MYQLLFREAFNKSFGKIRDDKIRKQIWKKIKQLEEFAPLGKHLSGQPYWSIHIEDYRVIYLFFGYENKVEIVDIFSRKHDYRELR